jgi:hypothetical protein
MALLTLGNFHFHEIDIRTAIIRRKALRHSYFFDGLCMVMRIQGAQIIKKSIFPAKVVHLALSSERGA